MVLKILDHKFDSEMVIIDNKTTLQTKIGKFTEIYTDNLKKTACS